MVKAIIFLFLIDLDIVRLKKLSTSAEIRNTPISGNVSSNNNNIKIKEKK
jgi:hypothetical protein